MAPVDRDPRSIEGTMSSGNWSILHPDMEASRGAIGSTADKCLMQCKMLLSPAKDQYIKLRSSSDGGLPYSAKLRFGSTYWKLHGEQRLATIGSSYVAQVSVGPSAELNSASDFENAKKMLLGIVITEKVLVDKLRRQTSDLASSIQSKLAELGYECGQCSNSGHFLYELNRLAEKHSYDVNFDFCKEMCSNRFVLNKSLKVDIVMYSAMQNCLKDRSVFLGDDQWAMVLDKEKQLLKDFLKAVMVKHKDLLLETCSPLMKYELEKLDADRFMLLTAADLTVFSDMERNLEGKLLKEALPAIIRNYIQRITAFDCSQMLPATNVIYFYTCKSLLELAKRVEAELDIQNSISFDGIHWKISPEAINVAKSTVEKCLVKQLHMLIVFAAFFDPGNSTVNDTIYQCQIELFKSFTFSHDEQRMWACIVDTVMVSIFRRDYKRIDEFSEMLKTFLQFLVSNGQQKELQESNRMVVHTILEFAAVVEQYKLEQDEIGKQVLQKQLPFICQGIRQSKTDCARLKAVTSVFQDCWIWSKRGFSKLMNTLSGKYLAPHLRELKSKHLHIILCALDRDVSVVEITRFFKTFNQLSMDLEALRFEWYVRVHNKKILKTLIAKKAIKNAIRGADNDCFLVIEDKYDEFIDISADEVIPKHYQVEIVKTLLDYIAISLDKRCWNDVAPLTEHDQLNVSMALIDAIRTSLLRLNEQPNYENFMQFYKERTKPFKSILKECDSITSFTKRMSLLKQSLNHTRNQYITDVDKAFGLFTTLNKNINEELLKKAFMLYVGQFEKHIRECNDLEYADKIKRIVRHVEDKVCPIKTSKWTAGFKQNSIPLILAGVRAVWSVLTTVDAFNTGKFVMSHALQILSILKLLCVDNNAAGVEAHLAQVMTDQEKPLVLGLIATVLALFGHKVEIAYHSKHLAKRDAAQLGDLYDAFQIKSKISYKTIDDLVDERMRAFSDKAWLYVSERLGISHESSKIDAQDDADLSNTVLLMNEFDIFLDKYCGQTSYNVFAPEITGLGQIQQKIWEFVQNGSEDIEHQIESFVQSSSDPDIETLKSLVERPGSYKLITIDHSAALQLLYSNKTFFAQQLNQMVKTAKEVHSKPPNDEYSRNFKLDFNGVIRCKNDFGEYYSNLYCQYFNAFYYFQLKKDNFVQNVNGCANFGYLPLDFSSFSYAKIMDYYPLALYFTEKLEDFKPIKQNVLLPSYCGTSKLKFNQLDNFKCLTSLSEWRNAIFTRINDITNENRSVIVFFNNLIEIKQFSLDFKQQLDRLNELTMETDDENRERYVNEAGVSRTVTLLTREMARDVEFEPSLAVVENGGIHVIQSFFSLDGNEETHIKSRTARMGNRGSYELIVGMPHLVALKLVDSNAKNSAVSYAQLEKLRKNISQQVCEDKANCLRVANEKHDMVVKFYENV